MSPPHRCWLGTPARHRAGPPTGSGARRSPATSSSVRLAHPGFAAGGRRRAGPPPLCSWAGPRPGGLQAIPAPAPAATGRGVEPDVLLTAGSGSRNRTRTFTPPAPGGLAGPRQCRKPSFAILAVGTPGSRRRAVSRVLGEKMRRSAAQRRNFNLQVTPGGFGETCCTAAPALYRCFPQTTRVRGRTAAGAVRRHGRSPCGRGFAGKRTTTWPLARGLRLTEEQVDLVQSKVILPDRVPQSLDVFFWSHGRYSHGIQVRPVQP